MQHESLHPITGSFGERAGNGGAEAEPADVEAVDLELGEQVEQQVGHGPRRVTPAQWRRLTVTREIGNDQRPIARRVAEAATELLG